LEILSDVILICYRRKRDENSLLLHKLVSVQARTGKIQSAKHQSVPVHPFGVRIRGIHQREHPETVRQVPGH